MTRPASLRRNLLYGVMLCAGFLLVAGLGLLLVEQPDPAPWAEHESTTDTASPVTELLEQHDCWTGDAPADMMDKLPGHVVTQHGLGGERMVKKALEQLPPSMDGPGLDHGLTVYGFCR